MTNYLNHIHYDEVYNAAVWMALWRCVGWSYECRRGRRTVLVKDTTELYGNLIIKAQQVDLGWYRPFNEHAAGIRSGLSAQGGFEKQQKSSGTGSQTECLQARAWKARQAAPMNPSHDLYARETWEERLLAQRLYTHHYYGVTEVWECRGFTIVFWY